GALHSCQELLSHQLPGEFAMRSDAVLSPCRRYCFALWRRWGNGPQVLFVLLNPSTVDESTDDPTVRRCIGFARSWGFGSVAIGTLFTFRTRSPAPFASCLDPVGPGNDHWLIRLRDKRPWCSPHSTGPDATTSEAPCERRTGRSRCRWIRCPREVRRVVR